MLIIDNFMPSNEFLELQNKVMDYMFPWFYSDHVSLPPDSKEINDPLAIETSGFHHIVYDNEDCVESFTNQYFVPFYIQLEKQFGFKQSHLIRSRVSTKLPKIGFTENNYNLPHVDYMFPHETIIFYLNDSDGDTRVFEEVFTPTGKNTGLKPATFNTKTRVTPQANRLLWIKGFQYHTASNPINSSRRIILNVNLDPL